MLGRVLPFCRVGQGPLLHVSGRVKEETDRELRKKLGKLQTENICQTLTVGLIAQQSNKW